MIFVGGWTMNDLRRIRHNLREKFGEGVARDRACLLLKCIPFLRFGYLENVALVGVGGLVIIEIAAREISFTSVFVCGLEAHRAECLHRAQDLPCSALKRFLQN